MEAFRVLIEEYQKVKEQFSQLNESQETGFTKIQSTPETNRILRRMRLPKIGFLLVGLAYENVAKGIMVTNTPELINNGKLSNGLKGSHLKLPDWLKDAGVELSDQQHDLVRRIGEATQ